MTEHVDVLILGAGLSGIGAAARLSQEHPRRSYALLEARAASGGTWDLFRYPGIRSDSDMFTLGYRFRPWTGSRGLADGASILDYVRDTAREYGVDRRIRYRHRAVEAAWDSGRKRWTVLVETPDGTTELTCSFLWGCTGYFDYDEGYAPEFAGVDDFRGTLVHPQHWPEDLEYAGKRVVVIGSGATAVTLVPAMAEDAEHVTMLQRSPSYVVSLPGTDPVHARLSRFLPARAVHTITRWKSILLAQGLYRLSRARPATVRRLVRDQAAKQLPGVDVDTHFRPRYDPWDQRMCFVPDGDLFRALRHGDAEIVTDTVERFTPTGLRLGSGRELEADVVVSATGLNLLGFGGLRILVDGDEVKLPQTMAYRAMMLSGVPNYAYTIGYTNSSWTLKADLVADYVCRLLAHLDARGLSVAVPRRDPDVGEAPFMDFTPNYVLRSLDRLPVQGDREPWRMRQSYLHDRRQIRRAPIDDGVLELS